LCAVERLCTLRPLRPPERTLLVASAFALAAGGCVGELRQTSPEDAGARVTDDAGVSEDAALWGADVASSPVDAPADDTPAPPGVDAWAPLDCVGADLVFAEDFESGGPRAFTGMTYDDAWGDGCQSTATRGGLAHGGSFAQRSEIVCASSEDVHRGYGGLQFEGDRVASAYTNTGVGLVAPSGVVSTHWVHLRAGAPFRDGRWLTVLSLEPSCDYTSRALTVGLDRADGLLHAAHFWPEGSERVEPGAVPMPYEQWVRLTFYLDLDDGVLHVWQDGRSTLHVTGIVRVPTSYCQWHWGLYASGDNTDVVLHEDDFALHRLHAPWTEWSREPWLGGSVARCP
jgi:hypothetical protein